MKKPPSHTRRFNTLTQSDLAADSSVLFALDAKEQRAQLGLWQQMLNSDSMRCLAIEKQESESITIRDRGQSPAAVALRDEKALERVLACDCLYVDISGLAHHVWAPILRVARRVVKKLRAVYIEPTSYRLHPSPASPMLFDLSEEFGGLQPLPGFARLSGPVDDNKVLLVALLGFEGNRPLQLAFQLDVAPPPRVIPVIGVPGFRVEYPALAIACNRAFLSEYRAHSELRFARASCPFEVAFLLAELQREYPEHYMYLLPVGTKPHSLGAIWYAIEHPNTTEIVYDHPRIKPGRTSGSGLIHVYSLLGDPDD